MAAIVDGFEGELKELREVFNSGKTREASWRRSQLKGILSLFKERESDIMEALNQDLGKHNVEAYRDEVITQSSNVTLSKHQCTCVLCSSHMFLTYSWF